MRSFLVRSVLYGFLLAGLIAWPSVATPKSNSEQPRLLQNISELDSSFPTGISGKYVVGVSFQNEGPEHAVYWDLNLDQRAKLLAVPALTSSSLAWGLDGVVAVGAVQTGSISRAVSWNISTGTYRLLPEPTGATSSVAYGISGNRVIGHATISGKDITIVWEDFRKNSLPEQIIQQSTLASVGLISNRTIAGAYEETLDGKQFFRPAIWTKQANKWEFHALPIPDALRTNDLGGVAGLGDRGIVGNLGGTYNTPLYWKTKNSMPIALPFGESGTGYVAAIRDNFIVGFEIVRLVLDGQEVMCPSVLYWNLSSIFDAPKTIQLPSGMPWAYPSAIQGQQIIGHGPIDNRLTPIIWTLPVAAK